MLNDQVSTAPCKTACPIHIDVPRYIRAIANEKFEEALEVIREKLPFPSICGRICYHPCEDACNGRGVSGGGPIAIRALKRFVVENTNCSEVATRISELTGKKIAIIGSGPAGLTAAFFLRRLGHDVVVFEKFAATGGMLRYGIPGYRLPKNIITNEINAIRLMGVKIRTNTSISNPAELLSEGFHAVFVAVGSQKGLSLGIEGEQIPGVHDCIKFLRKINDGNNFKVGKSVAVIGGGNAAIDAARCSIRLGADDVVIIYRRSREEMPASDEEVREAQNEGICFDYQSFPMRVAEKEGRIQLHLMRTKLKELDDSGRRRPLPVPDSEYIKEVDMVIRAIGQMPDIDDDFIGKTTDRNLVKVCPTTLATDIKGIFAGGDVVSGPGSFIDAVASGRKAASAIDKYLGGEGNIDIFPVAPEGKVLRTAKQGIPIGERVPIPCLAVEQRLLDPSSSVEIGYNKEQAIQEAERCLRCDLPIQVNPNNCTGCLTCVMRCSLKNQNTFNPYAANLSIVPFSDEKVNEITFTPECDSCGICARYCPHDALYRGEFKANGAVSNK